MEDAVTGHGACGPRAASSLLLALCLALVSACKAPDISGFQGRPDAVEGDAPASAGDGAQETAGALDTASPEVAPDTPPAEVEADADPADSDPGPTVVTVSLDPQGGQITGEASLSRTVGGSYGPLPEVTRAGHEHLGWWTEPDQGGDAVDGETLVTRETDHTLYAAWASAPAPRFVTLPPGSFQMGSPPDELGREPNETRHPVTLTRAFRLAVTEVTHGEWEALSGGVNPSSDPDCGDTCPVDNLSWWSALGYANARSTADGLAPCYALSGCIGAWQDGSLACPDNALGLAAATVLDCDGYRLPTEAEWEYAARAGTETATYAGDLSALEGCPTVSGAGAFPAGTPLGDLAWYPCNSEARLHPVAEKAANLWGLHDMLGNVQEWTYDFRDTYNVQDTDPIGPATGRDGRVFRGGSALAEVWNQRAAARPSGQPNARSAALGLRLARTAPPCEPACRNGGYCTDVGTCSCPDSHEGPTCADPILVTVTFDAQGGTTPTPDTRDLLFSAPYGALPETSRHGYTFEGWWTAPEASGEQATLGARVTRRDPYTLFAAWDANHYVVTLDSAGGSPCEPLTVTFDAPYGGLCTPSRAGYTFDGWSLDGDGTGGPITPERRVATAEDHALRARWTAVRLVVTFDPEGGSPCEAVTVTHGQPYGPLCATTRPKDVFAAWTDTDNGAGMVVTAESMVTATADHTLFARWSSATFTVTFQAGEGTLPAPPGKTVILGGLYGLLATSERAGYTFDGWWTGPDGDGVEVTPQTEVTRAENHDLYARWTPATYQVLFDSAGGSDCVPRTVTFDAPYGEDGPLCAPTRAGYLFAGWSLAADDLASSAITDETRVSTAGDHGLFARWTANTYMVTYDSEGGSACAARRVTFGSAYGAHCTPSRTGFTFLGWTHGDNGTGSAVRADTAVATAGDHTLYARWQSSGLVPGYVAIPAGSFTMGSPADEVGRQPQEVPRTVTLTRAFLLGKTEVTQGEWKALSGGVNPSRFSTCGDDCPVERVSWWSALGYLNALSDAHGLPRCYVLPTTKPDGTACTGTWQAGTFNCQTSAQTYATLSPYDCIGYRLPTEAEWEYAARAGTTTATYAGDNLTGPSGSCARAQPHLDEIAWWCQNSGDGTAGSKRTRGVGGRAPNAWGLHDMFGNVFEFVNDGYSAYAAGSTDPEGPYPSVYRGMRGGCYYCGDTDLRAASRNYTGPYVTDHAEVGFRVARTAPEPRVVTYDTGGGEGCGDPVSVTFGSKYPSLCTPSRAGFTFRGWFLGSSLAGTLVTGGTTVVSTATDHTLHARWLPAAAATVPQLVTISPGTFTMGSQANEVGRDNDETQRSVTLTHAFQLGQTEVTQGQWKALSGDTNPANFRDWVGDEGPIESLTWWSALGYLNALSESQGLTACYVLPSNKPDGSPCAGTWQAGTLDCGTADPTLGAPSLHGCPGYRLPTEAEWEFAARAGTTTATYGGDLSAGTGCVTLSGAGAFPTRTPLSVLGRYVCPGVSTAPVARHAANPFGLFDMLGNVWEVTHDWYSAATAGTTDPVGPVTGTTRVKRGGGYGGDGQGAPALRAARRAGANPSARFANTGFRVARTAL